MNKPQRVVIAIIILSMVVPVAGIAATTINVPGDYNTIQAAINAASSGEDVLVHDGTYQENIDFMGKTITVHSVNGAEFTIIDGSNPSNPDKGTVVTFSSGENSYSVLDGFTITKGRGTLWTGEGAPPGPHAGGILCNGSSPMIKNCTVTNNSVAGAGGGILCVFSSSPVITGCVISENKANNSGGGIFIVESSSPTITDCIISNNTAVNSNGGGIVCDTSTSPTITGCTISGNTAGEEGGGIEADASSPTISNCIIADNKATEGGGGIHCHEDTVSLTNCTISGNEAIEGAGIESDGSSVAINNCIIINNTSTVGAGGGIRLYNPSSTTISNSTISGNSSPHGSGIFCHISSPQITNCLISGNANTTSSGGAGMAFNGNCSPTIVNTTVAHNKGGGISCLESSTITVINSIIWGNENDPEIYVSPDSSYSITYSDIRGGDWESISNINADPKFINPRPASEAPTIDGDYHLKSKSPCIDASNSNPPAPAEDRDGNPRYDDPATPDTGAGASTYYDMGAYEYQGIPCPIYVPDDIGTIQEAIDAAIDGCEIIVKNGTYTENINFKGKAVTLRTTEGAVIDGNNSGNVVTFNSGEDSNSVLDGFTITNGSATYGGGIYCSSSSSPLISNCIIFSNLGSTDGGGFYFTSSSPTIQNCIVKDNTVNYSGGGFCILWSSPTIANSTIKNNVGSGITCGTGSHSYIVNCLITNNTYSPNTDAGGGLGCGGGNPLVVNSTITSNLAITYGGGIYLQDSCSATVINSIAWGNKNESGGAYSTEIFIRDSNGSIDVSYSDIQGGYTGTGNIDSDPLFVGDGNYHLQSGSPCIDAANSSPPAPATDKNGDVRYDDPATEDSGTGPITYYDMGAYEYLGSGTASIDLNDGWNLISLNFHPANPAIEEVLGIITDNCNSVWMFNNGWKAYYPAYPEYSDLDKMETGWGYWLNMSAATTLPVSGTIPSKTIYLNAGWNLVGYNSAASLPIAEAIESITGDCESVWTYINGEWKAYYPAFPEYSDLEDMYPNYGYWIKTKKACNWMLPQN